MAMLFDNMNNSNQQNIGTQSVPQYIQQIPSGTSDIHGGSDSLNKPSHPIASQSPSHANHAELSPNGPTQFNAHPAYTLPLTNSTRILPNDSVALVKEENSSSSGQQPTNSTNNQGSNEEEKKQDSGEECTTDNGQSSSELNGKDHSSLVLQINAPPHPVAEFLFQLTKMLTDNNSQYIEWSNASIYVHDPPGLEKNILPKYFRHSNYSSFQRQMNYFGFRKIAGKGKMAPCSYVNEAAKEDISSLLFIKRKKTGVSSSAAKLMAQHNRLNRSMNAGFIGGQFPLLAGGLGVAQPLALNNFQGASMGSFVGGGPFASTLLAKQMGGKIPNHDQALTREQQMLAQLQQSHAASVGMGVPGVSQGFSQHKLGIAGANGNITGINLNGVLPGSAGGPLFTNDQGNVYTPVVNTNWSGLPAERDISGGQNNHSLSLQQPVIGNGFPQGEAAGVKRLDSAANLRALLNHQISLFSNGQVPQNLHGQTANFPTNLNVAGHIQPSGMIQIPVTGSQPFHPQFQAGSVAIPSAAGPSSSLLSYDLLQRNSAPGAPIENGASLRQFDGMIQRNPAPGPNGINLNDIMTTGADASNFTGQGQGFMPSGAR